MVHVCVIDSDIVGLLHHSSNFHMPKLENMLNKQSILLLFFFEGFDNAFK
jgi:hypothetical protein